MASQKNRTVFIAALTIAVVGFVFAFIVAANGWYFSETEHRRITSPSGRWVVIIMKRMVRFIKPIEIRLKVVESRRPDRINLDVFLEERDLWDDVRLESFPIDWKSDTEFRVKGILQPGDNSCFRGSLLGDMWVVDSIPATQN